MHKNRRTEFILLLIVVFVHNDWQVALMLASADVFKEALLQFGVTISVLHVFERSSLLLSSLHLVGGVLRANIDVFARMP